MILPAVLLDAAMTVLEARDRLARAGHWRDADDPAVTAVLDDLIARIDAAARRAGDAIPPGEYQPLTREDAAEFLARPDRPEAIAVRRAEHGMIWWYAFRSMERVFDAFDAVGSDLSVQEALDLASREAVPVRQREEFNDALFFTRVQGPRSVVFDGGRFVGIYDPPLMSAPPSMARPAPSASPGGTRSATDAGDGPTRSGAAPVEPAPTRDLSAFPRVDTPRDVVVGTRFDVVIGLGAEAQPGDATTPMQFTVAADATTLDLDIQLLAVGFTAPSGWRHALQVPVSDPTSVTISVPLVADAQQEAVRATTITVQFVADGVTRGIVTRHITVTRADAVGAPAMTPASGGTAWNALQPESAPLALNVITAVPDIELNIAKPDGNPASTVFHCTMRNAHGLPVPDAPIPIYLGTDARGFARQIIDELPRYDGTALLEHALVGHGERIADKLPMEFWDLLHAVAAKVGDARPVTLQLNSGEPNVPWELARVEPPVDASRVPYLAAQVVMGRWILGDRRVTTPPRAQLCVQGMALMAGMYKAVDSGMKKLPKAEEEVAELLATFKSRGAMKFECDSDALATLLNAGVGEPTAVHFAGHGQVDPQRPWEAAIYLSNGKPITPTVFRGSKLGKKFAPFLFLNACMVGTAGETLGDYGGFAGDCLAGNFSGLVAPLWAVNDEIAKWMALEFYREAMASPGRPVPEILRDLRGSYAEHPNASSYLAYVYYGSPHLTFA